ncbi:hypothetical protein TNCV_1081261 [Trichonephila clavipes]|nr:hypothetical protein TNCV_1081261 [Trichonephila clavipes]
MKIITVNNYEDFSSDFPVSQDILPPLTERFQPFRVMGIHKRHISSYSAHVNGRVEKPNQSLANILASISQNTNDWDEQLPHTILADFVRDMEALMELRASWTSMDRTLQDSNAIGIRTVKVLSKEFGERVSLPHRKGDAPHAWKRALPPINTS